MPIQQTAEMTQPEMAFSDAHSPVYYTGKTKAAIPHFKRSVNYLKFKQEYEQSIQSIIDFYNQHAPNLGQDEITTDLPESLRKKSTVENMFMQFKMALFDVKNFDRLHHLYPSEIKMQDLAPGNYRLSEIPENLPFVVASPQRSLRYRS